MENEIKQKKLTENEFYEKYCKKCNSILCEGMNTGWIEGCKYRDELASRDIEISTDSSAKKIIDKLKSEITKWTYNFECYSDKRDALERLDAILDELNSEDLH